ncbi:hypothetical protein JTB14_008939 [Gonioctena quinquepunctata]|nr:hypothetical protein JTB14_008939 [Gonioctena quinquepunctata]
MERKKYMQIVEGHKIICSKECSTKKNSEEDDLRKAGEKLELLIITVREKEDQLESTIRQRDDRTHELLEEIAKLKKDNRERDEFIQKLRRTSMDFEDEVVGAEQNYISNLNEQKGIITEQKKDITNLIQKNTALQEELEEIRVDLNRYQTDITDLNTINKNMMTSFETITQEKESYLVKLKKLEYDYASLRQVHYNKNQFKKKENTPKQPNTNYSPVEKQKNDREGNIDYEVPLQSGTPKNRILFVSGYHGRGMNNHLAQTSEYFVQSIRKPGSSDEELIHTALMNSKDFSRNDSVILWLNKTNASIIDTFTAKTQQTQILIISKPYRYDININQMIYEENMNLHKKLHY